MILRPRPSACLVFVLSLFIAAAAQAQSQSQAPSAYDAVHPTIGTSGDGNTFPGATLPFGMIQWSPDTGTDGWYHYDQHRIYGLSLTHLSGAGCTMYADFPVLPFPGELTVSPHKDRDRYTVPFDHTHETAHPGYYSLTLSDGTQVEITVTDRAGIAHFRFPAGTPARLLVNAGGSANSGEIDKKPDDPNRSQDGFIIRLVGDKTVEGRSTAVPSAAGPISTFSMRPCSSSSPSSRPRCGTTTPSTQPPALKRLATPEPGSTSANSARSP